MFFLSVLDQETEPLPAHSLYTVPDKRRRGSNKALTLPGLGELFPAGQPTLKMNDLMVLSGTLDKNVHQTVLYVKEKQQLVRQPDMNQ